MRRHLVFVAFSVVFAFGFPLISASAATPVDFETQVRPILARSCFACHSESQASAGLRLDTRADALRALTPGSPETSLLLQRVNPADAAKPRMPLAGKPLAPDQIATLAAWIREGAAYPDTAPRKHWAYVQPVRPTPPTAAANPVDAFIQARLARENLKLAPEASRETLIRRLSFDLTGLPPTLSEIDAFLADTRPNAYERLVDRLLASPRFGERWARPWLDMARYADTNGMEKDRRRSIWKYRDWVIDAFNADMPFDRFTIEQIAGDMLPNPTVSQKIATGFHRNSMFNEEGGVDKDEAFFETLIDRVGTTSTVWLGSTLGCAQCHNHKFDPFSQKDFYRMMAFFNNGERRIEDYGDTSQKYLEPELMLPTPAQDSSRTQLETRIRALESRIQTADLSAEQADWERAIRAAAADWTPLNPTALSAKSGATLTALPDSSIRASGPNERSESFTLEAPVSAKAITAIRLEALPDPSLPRGGPGRDVYGNFFLKDLKIEGFVARDAVSDDGPVRFNRPSDSLWTVDASRDDQRLPRQLILIAAVPFTPTASTLKIALRFESEFAGQALGRFRLSFTTVPDPAVIAAVGAKIRPAFEKSARTPAEQKQISDSFRARAVSLKADRDRIKDLRKQLDELAIAGTLILQERAQFERPSTELRIRGQFLSKGETVYAATPAALHPFPESELPNRLGLARWLVSKDNPLTARVTVNRIWEQYFGHGIVETSEDFGAQGERPTHPELLDWLAVEFMEKGWSQKAVHRLIVTSQTYKQSSRMSPEAVEKDPYNRLLARGPRFRLEAEMIRDLSLSAAGLLSAKIGGPSVFPPQPDGVWDIPYSDDKWTESKGEDRYRRALYTFIRRSAPYPSLVTFDGTSREFCTVRRIRTDTPLQALTTLNDPAFFEAAQALARRAASEGEPDPAARASYMFRLCTGRRPNPAELSQILKSLGGQPTPARWALTANALLNLDETLTKE